MGAFYVSIIFLGILLVIGSLFFIAMDKVNGKDFFKEFDRKKEEMFNLIQESEEMVQELNRISDYVVTTIAEKNQEFFDKMNRTQESSTNKTADISSVQTDTIDVPVTTSTRPTIPVMVNSIPIIPVSKVANPVIPVTVKNVPQQKEVIEPKIEYTAEEIKTSAENNDVVTSVEADNTKRVLNTQMSDISERLNKDDANKSRLVLNNKRREVLRMIEQGMSNDEIADKLKIGKGEIGLIRGLSK